MKESEDMFKPFKVFAFFTISGFSVALTMDSVFIGSLTIALSSLIGYATALQYTE